MASTKPAPFDAFDVKTTLRNLDEYQIREVIHLLYNQPIAIACYESIVAQCSKLNITTTDTKMELNPMFEKYVAKPFYIKYIADWIRMQMTVGVCGTRIVVLPDGRMIPFVCPVETLRWRIGHTRDGRIIFSVQSKDHRHISDDDSSIRVTSVYPPDLNGQLTTPLAALLCHHSFTKKIRDCVQAAVQNNVRPRILEQKRSVNMYNQMDFGKHSVLSHPVQADKDERVVEQDLREVHIRDEAAAELAQKQEAQAIHQITDYAQELMRAEESTHMRMGRPLASDSNVAFLDARSRIEGNYERADVLYSQPYGELSSVQEQFEYDICYAMGIKRQTFRSEKFSSRDVLEVYESNCATYNKWTNLAIEELEAIIGMTYGMRYSEMIIQRTKTNLNAIIGAYKNEKTKSTPPPSPATAAAEEKEKKQGAATAKHPKSAAGGMASMQTQWSSPFTAPSIEPESDETIHKQRDALQSEVRRRIARLCDMRKSVYTVADILKPVTEPADPDIVATMLIGGDADFKNGLDEIHRELHEMETLLSKNPIVVMFSSSIPDRVLWLLYDRGVIGGEKMKTCLAKNWNMPIGDMEKTMPECEFKRLQKNEEKLVRMEAEAKEDQIRLAAEFDSDSDDDDDDGKKSSSSSSSSAKSGDAKPKKKKKKEEASKAKKAKTATDAHDTRSKSTRK